MYYDALQDIEDKIDNQPSGDINGPYNLYYENYTSVPVTVSIPGNIKYVIGVARCYGAPDEILCTVDKNPHDLSGQCIELVANYNKNTIKIYYSDQVGGIVVNSIDLYVFYY